MNEQDNPLEKLWWKLREHPQYKHLFKITNDEFEIDISVLDGRIYGKTPFSKKKGNYIAYRTLNQNQNSFELFLREEFPELLL